MFKFIISQVAVTSLCLGAMKKHGIIVLETKQLKNESLKYCIVKGVELGENAVGVLEGLFASASNQISEIMAKKK